MRKEEGRKGEKVLPAENGWRGATKRRQAGRRYRCGAHAAAPEEPALRAEYANTKNRYNFFFFDMQIFGESAHYCAAKCSMNKTH